MESANNQHAVGCARCAVHIRLKLSSFSKMEYNLFHFEAKKMCFFRFARMQAKHFKKRKQWKRNESEKLQFQ
jgi:hypothetical protein